MGAVDGALSLLSQIDQFLFFYKVDGNLLVCLLKGDFMIHIMSRLRPICAKDLTSYAPLDADGLNLV